MPLQLQLGKPEIKSADEFLGFTYLGNSLEVAGELSNSELLETVSGSIQKDGEADTDKYFLKPVSVKKKDADLPNKVD